MTPFVVEKLIAIVSDCHGAPAALRVAGPRVDDELTPVVHGHGGAATALVRGDAPQRLGDATEVGMHEAGDHLCMVARFSDRPGIG